MDAIWLWGIELIRLIQVVRGPVLDGIFKAITFLGDQEFLLILMPLIFWNVKFRTGIRFAVTFLLAVYVNVLLKEIFAHPRPFDLTSGINLIEIEGYGLPSGHAQSAVIVWGMIASEVREKWAWVGAVALMVLIGFSRIYLGVHFPTDVLGGWLIGAFLLLLYLRFSPAAEAWLLEQRWQVRFALIIGVSSVLLLLRIVPDTVLALATLAGIGLGGLLLDQLRIRFTADGSIWQRAARFFLGIAGLLILYAGLKQLFPGEGESFYLLMRFVRYLLIGLWVSWIAPYFFDRLHLATEQA
ncbi:MAG TPA: phosphatase PAP2 family protein [Chloroflexi bacterium]|nr:phosphatase PAP2 family protein [Chloroflexota bacterium]